MSNTARPKLDITLRVDEDIYEFSTALVDYLELEKRSKNGLAGNVSDMIGLVYNAGKRKEYLTCTFGEFVNDDERYEFELEQAPSLKERRNQSQAS